MTKTVKQLKEKMTAEKAIAFLNEENKKKTDKGLAILQKAIEDMQEVGCGIAVRNTLNENNQILNNIQVVVTK